MLLERVCLTPTSNLPSLVVVVVAVAKMWRVEVLWEPTCVQATSTGKRDIERVNANMWIHIKFVSWMARNTEYTELVQVQLVS